MASQITSLAIVYSTVYSDADQRKHQSSASRAFVRGIHRWPMNSPHKGPVTRKMFPFSDGVIMGNQSSSILLQTPCIRPSNMSFQASTDIRNACFNFASQRDFKNRNPISPFHIWKSGLQYNTQPVYGWRIEAFCILPIISVTAFESQTNKLVEI